MLTHYKNQKNLYVQFADQEWNQLREHLSKLVWACSGQFDQSSDTSAEELAFVGSLKTVG